MTIKFNDVYINNTSIVGGPFLYDGPLKGRFDDIYTDFYDGEKTYEDCEIKEYEKCINILLSKEDKKPILAISSDLNNQLYISSSVYRKIGIPYLGIYSACASFCESLIIGSSMVNKDSSIICSTSSHNMTAERNYRNPTEYGAPKPDYSTFTACSSVGCTISTNKGIAKIESGTIGTVYDLDTKDSSDMGSAMVPAAAKTLYEHLSDTKRDISYYDLIVTGDLGKYGLKIFKRYFFEEYGYDLNNYTDSSINIYNMEDKRVLAGGSGPSCLPTYLFTKIIPEYKNKKILLLATGALLNMTSTNQKKSIPSICHAVSLEVL